MPLIRWNEQKDGPISESAMRRKMEKPGCRVCRYHYPPGTLFPPHTHAVEKIDGVLSGRLQLEMDGRTLVLTAGDMLVLPRHVVHSARVLGNESVIARGVSVQNTCPPGHGSAGGSIFVRGRQAWRNSDDTRSAHGFQNHRPLRRTPGGPAGRCSDLS